jgi:hypothetical protein
MVIEAERAGNVPVYSGVSSSKSSEMLRSFGENLRSFGDIGGSQSAL